MRSEIIRKFVIVVLCVTIILVAWKVSADHASLVNIQEKIRDLTRQQQNLRQQQENLTVEKDAFLLELNHLRNKANDTKEQIQSVQSKISKLKSRNKYILHDPSYAEVVEFIRKDKTDKNKYVENEYTCVHFARDVNNNAENEGIRCGFVIINLSGSANHAIIAFNTTDRGIVYFEPQTDERLRYLKVGKDYWADCVIPKGNYYYERDPNDIIIGYVIIW